MSAPTNPSNETEPVTHPRSSGVDWPRSLGYFGSIGLALALDFIAPPLALVVAALPALQRLARRESHLAATAPPRTAAG